MKILETLGVVSVISIVLLGANQGFELKGHISALIPHEVERNGTLSVVPLMVEGNSWEQMKASARSEVEQEQREQEKFSRSAPLVLGPQDTMPRRIIVGADVYTVKFTTHVYMTANECGAFTDHQTHTIWLDEWEVPLSRRDTLIHELLHAAMHEAGGRKNVPHEGVNEDHDVIEPLTPVLLEVLRDNKQLTEWLQEAQP